MKYRHIRHKITKKLGILNNQSKTIVWDDDPMYGFLLKKYQENTARAEKDSALRSLGLTKVKGSLGGIYWE